MKIISKLSGLFKKWLAYKPVVNMRSFAVSRRIFFSFIYMKNVLTRIYKTAVLMLVIFQRSHNSSLLGNVERHMAYVCMYVCL